MYGKLRLPNSPNVLFGKRSSNGANSTLYSACSELGPCQGGAVKPRRDLVEPCKLPMDLKLVDDRNISERSSYKN